MDISLSAVITILAAIVGAIVGALIPTIFKRIDDKRACRIKPSVSIWCNKKDDIDERLKTQGTRWFLKIEDLNAYLDDHFYIVVTSENRFRMRQSRVEIKLRSQDIKEEERPSLPPFDIGTIDSKSRAVLPLKYSCNENRVECSITYYTEKKEKMLYLVEFSINHALDKVYNRTDSTYILYENRKKGVIKRRKEIERINVNEFKSYSSNEISKKLGKGGTLNSPRQGDANGNHN
ncbi:MAG: hypothetical protein K2O04_05160 [Clostridiales bacterium]|nr:hypothetical protein [Clostridiales bacterium]